MLRFEYKYIVPLEQLDRLRTLIRPFMEPDRHAGADGGVYTVRSIYFDTYDLECYFHKLAGVKRRNKVRLRGYNKEEDGNPVFFEIKKKVDEPLFKNRAATTFGEAMKILRGGSPDGSITKTAKVTYAEALANAQRFMYHVHARRMRPVVTVVYEREPYQAILKDQENDLRITFDRNLRAVPDPQPEDLFKEKISYPVNPRSFILEIKFNRYMPTWLRAITASLGLKKGPASKYAMAIEACPGIAATARQMPSTL